MGEPVKRISAERFKRIAVLMLKFTIPILLLVWVVSRLDPKQIEQIWQRDKNWPLLIGCVGMILAGVVVSFCRWYLLVRSIGIEFTLRDALRLGFLGYLFNFVSVGSVGGDLFKAIFVAREQPGWRAEAVASVLVDRVIGLYSLLLITSAAMLSFDVAGAPPEVQAVCRTTLIATLIGGIVLSLAMIPTVTRNRFVKKLTTIPVAGHILGRLMEALETVRGRPKTLAQIALMSFAVHGCMLVGVIGIGYALFDNPPTILEQMIIIPISNVASALPFTPAGLGAFELAMDELTRRVPVSTDASGAVIALGFRVSTIVVAGIGVVVYFYSKREFQSVLKSEHGTGDKVNG
jgi:hypothetical protein